MNNGEDERSKRKDAANGKDTGGGGGKEQPRKPKGKNVPGRQEHTDLAKLKRLSRAEDSDDDWGPWLGTPKKRQVENKKNGNLFKKKLF